MSLFSTKQDQYVHPLMPAAVKTVAVTFTEINFSQCDIKLWTLSFKGLKGPGRA